MRFLAFCRRQFQYFQELPADQKRFMSASFLYSLAQPMLFLFSATFLWRQSEDPIVLALYYIGFYCGLPVGCLANSILLRRFSPKGLYLLGCLLGGAVPTLLVSMGASAADAALWLGLLLGFAGGVYWGNRNYLTAELTVNARRFKYISLEWVLMTVAAILSPLVIGWTLMFGERTGLYETGAAYGVCALVALVLLFGAGALVLGVKQTFARLDRTFVKHPSRDWNTMRLLDALNGAEQISEVIIPIVLLVTLIGAEDSIGVIQSATAVLAAAAMYLFGKRERHDHATVLSLWCGLTFIGRVVFAALNSLAGAFVLFGVEGFTGSFRWASLSSVMYEAVDREQRSGDITRRYIYIMDREFFLNAGRVFSLLVFITCYTFFPAPTIRFGMLSVLAVQIGMVLLTRALATSFHKSAGRSA